MASTYATYDDVRLASVLSPAEVDQVEARFPGLTAKRIRHWSADANDRLVKRYLVPFQPAPPEQELAGWTGDNPPSVSGIATTAWTIRVEITTPGASGVAMARYSLDGRTFTAPSLVSGPIVLGSSGLTWTPGTGDLDGVALVIAAYPETLVGYVATHAANDLLRVRSPNPESGQQAEADKLVAKVDEWMAQAVDPEHGVVELPPRQDNALGASAVTHTATWAYSEATPYTWTDVQAEQAYEESR